ncbi:MAG: hypothetical protein NTY22_01275 [Proteobacteria bacterium]|nr:hypothetical protein [Pseudomonadota bacterium]
MVLHNYYTEHNSFIKKLFLAFLINLICLSNPLLANDPAPTPTPPVDDNIAVQDRSNYYEQAKEKYKPPKLLKPPKVSEGFVALIVSQYISDTYYRVYVDENEDPYVNIRGFVSDYLGFENVKCDVKKLYCECTMPPNDTFFWFDGKNAELGNSEGKPQKFDPMSIVIKDDDIWVRFDVIGEWLPLDANWELDTYILGLKPRFKLVYDKKIEHQEMLKKLKARKEEQAAEERKKIIYPEDLFDASARYRLGIIKPTRGASSSSIDYELTLDAFTGTGKLGQSLGFTVGEKRNINAPYGTYTLKNKKYFYLMEVGSTSFHEASLLIHDAVASYGFRFDSRKQDQYVEGRISITDIAPKGTEVDLYVNGFYITAVNVGDDGRYSFPDINVNSSTTVKLKIYYPNGLEEEKPINISKGASSLPKGKFEERVFVGKLSQSNYNLYYSALRYGLLDNVSIGVSPMYLPTSKNVTPMVDMNFMPFYWINLFGQGLINGRQIDRGFRGDLTLLYPNFIQVEHTYYNPNSPLLPIGGNGTIKGEYWSFKHQVNFARIDMSTEYEQNQLSRKISNSFRFAITNHVRPFVTSDIYLLRGVNITTYDVETGFSLDFTSQSRMDISRVWSSSLSRNLLSYTLKDTSNIGGWDVNIKAEIDDNKTKNLSLGVNYRATENLQVGLTLQNQYVGGQIYWNGIIAGKNGPDSWQRFDSGTVSGRIVDTTEGEPKPVPDVALLIGNVDTITDAEGYYKVHGISVDQTIKARVDINSLDNRLTPDTDYDLLYLRKGTHINWYPTLVTTIGLDGYIDTEEDIIPGTKIIATRLSDSMVMSTSEIDPEDGFFVLERLTPGKYQISLDNENLKAKPVVIDIMPGTEWISGIRWDTDLQKFEFTKDTGAVEDLAAEKTVKIVEIKPEEAKPKVVLPLKEVDINELKSIQNIIQIKLHNAELIADPDSDTRITTYKKLIAITDKMQKEWPNLSLENKITNINKIKLILFSPRLIQDEINRNILQNLKLLIKQRISELEDDRNAKNNERLGMYERLYRLLDKLEQEWDKLSLNEKSKKLEGIKKIITSIERF